MFGSLFHSLYGGQSAGSGSTSTNQQQNPNTSQRSGRWPWGGSSGSGGSGGTGSNNNSQWPRSWPPRWGQGQQQQTTPPPAQTPAPTTPPTTTPPATTPPTYAPGTWQSNWEATQAAELLRLPEWARAAEQARDQKQRDWYAQNKSAQWFPGIERYLAHAFRNAPGGSSGGGTGGGGTSGGGSNGGGTPATPSAAQYTPGTFDRDPRAGT
jgi:hypothetical protein